MTAGKSQPLHRACERAAGLLRRVVLRPDVTSREVPHPAESWWLADPSAAAAVLHQEVPGIEPAPAVAFGGPWPAAEADGLFLAPGLPVAVGATEQQGPDGTYRASSGTVLREAAGRWQPVLRTGSPPGEAPGSPFDLLWFGDQERYLVRGPLLEVEDLFSTTTLPVTPALLDRLLLRGLRLEPESVAGLPLQVESFAPRVRVHRSLELMNTDGWRDPLRLLATRQGVRRVRRRGEHIEARTEAAELRYSVHEGTDSWQLHLVGGADPVTAFAMAVVDDYLEYEITLSEQVDPMQPGMRGRLAFDLNSDLVMLG